MPTHATHATELLAEIRARAAELQPRGEEIERTGRLPDDILEWIYDLKLFKLMVPTEFAGRPTPLPEMLHVFDELSAIDGSLGWLVHIGAAGGFFVPSFAKETARQLFSPREAVIAGTGFPAGLARPVEGGYKVSGRWLYASGAQYASLFTASARCEEDGKEKVRAFAFLPEQVTVINDWRAYGLKGTASNTFVVDEVFVPQERVFIVGDIKWPIDEPLYRLSFDMMAVTTIAAVCFGLARRFFDLAAEMPRWQTFAEAQSIASKAAQYRELFYVLARHWWTHIQNGDSPPRSEEMTVIQSIRDLVDKSITAVQRVFPYLGMRVLWETEPINRVYRDLQTAGQHIYLRG